MLIIEQYVSSYYNLITRAEINNYRGIFRIAKFPV